MTTSARALPRGVVPAASRVGPMVAGVLGVSGWALYAFMVVFSLTVGWRLMRATETMQFDWHVYATGAADLVERVLYRVPLTGPEMPVDAYNMPPLSALWAVPLLPLPLEVGGYVWQVSGAVALAVAAVVTARITGVPMPLRVAGIALGVLALNEGVIDGLLEGSNNYHVLLMLVGFAWAHLTGRDRWAGVLLGLAIATKIFPVALAVVLLRERRWTALRWTAGVVAVQGIVFLAWLGPDVLPHVLEALTLKVSAVSCCGMIGPAELRETFSWWPAFAGPMLAVVLLLPDARGRMGIGLGILAGLMLIPNLWLHYLPTVTFAVALVTAGVLLHRQPAIKRVTRPLDSSGRL